MFYVLWSVEYWDLALNDSQILVAYDPYATLATPSQYLARIACGANDRTSVMSIN